MSWKTFEITDLFNKDGKWVLASKEELMSTSGLKDYTLLEMPQKYGELFHNKHYGIVELVSITKLVREDKEIIAPGRFVGKFEWADNKPKPLDGDSYGSDMLVYQI